MHICFSVASFVRSFFPRGNPLPPILCQVLSVTAHIISSELLSRSLVSSIPNSSSPKFFLLSQCQSAATYPVAGLLRLCPNNFIISAAAFVSFRQKHQRRSNQSSTKASVVHRISATLVVVGGHGAGVSGSFFVGCGVISPCSLGMVGTQLRWDRC
jgi:hypothetical protein